MAVAAHISVEEYLHTVYRPDCDYVDGEVIERNLGEKSHSECQGRIYAYLLQLSSQLRIYPFIEWRVQISENRFRIPDVCVVAGASPAEEILTKPPFVAIEIFSPADSANTMQSRVNDYLHFGVRYVWLVDPIAKRAWVHSAGCSQESRSQESLDLILKTENPELVLPLREIFEAIR
jgi:Uma2 family endonuclease